MHLTEFIRDVRNDVNAFERWWERKHKVDPDGYPLRQDVDAWGEALIDFIENRDDDVNEEPEDDDISDFVPG